MIVCLDHITKLESDIIFTTAPRISHDSGAYVGRGNCYNLHDHPVGTSEAGIKPKLLTVLISDTSQNRQRFICKQLSFTLQTFVNMLFGAHSGIFDFEVQTRPENGRMWSPAPTIHLGFTLVHGLVRAFLFGFTNTCNCIQPRLRMFEAKSTSKMDVSFIHHEHSTLMANTTQNFLKHCKKTTMIDRLCQVNVTEMTRAGFIRTMTCGTFVCSPWRDTQVWIHETCSLWLSLSIEFFDRLDFCHRKILYIIGA
mmetsp:Transcript_47144/g.147542  ORF Transcript_47144/g.147542 Transcript_47144/m.147542 type:complete len:253 (+) Transcript_47144:347-1105(+)